MSAIEIFYSYSHKDKTLRGELEKRLSLLKRQGLIIGWSDRNIDAGREWANEIDTHLNTAQLILLLVSSDFIASDYCYSKEMMRAIERHERGEAHVIPIILRPTDWDESPLGKLEALPSFGKPITKWSNRDDAFLDVAKGIRKVVKELSTSTQSLIAKAVEPRTPLFDLREMPGGDAPRGENFISNYTLQVELAIKQKINSTKPWSILSIDLDNFKDFNAVYGFQIGNEIIRLLGRICQQVVQEYGNANDFVGHNGSHDFVILTTPDRAGILCKQISAAFNEQSVAFYRPDDLRRDSISSVDWNGRPIQLPLVSVSIGVVNNQGRRSHSLEEVSYLVEEAKYYAKLATSHVYHISPHEPRKAEH